MRRLWLRLWMALAVAASLLLPAGPLRDTEAAAGPARAVLGLAHAAHWDARRPEPGPHRDDARVQKGRPHDGSGAPPREASGLPPAIAWACFLQAGPGRTGCPALFRPRTFAPQGMQPEQGGQNGPPTALV